MPFFPLPQSILQEERGDGEGNSEGHESWDSGADDPGQEGEKLEVGNQSCPAFWMDGRGVAHMAGPVEDHVGVVAKALCALPQLAVHDFVTISFDIGVKGSEEDWRGRFATLCH